MANWVIDWFVRNRMMVSAHLVRKPIDQYKGAVKRFRIERTKELDELAPDVAARLAGVEECRLCLALSSDCGTSS